MLDRERGRVIGGGCTTVCICRRCEEIPIAAVAVAIAMKHGD